MIYAHKDNCFRKYLHNWQHRRLGTGCLKSCFQPPVSPNLGVNLGLGANSNPRRDVSLHPLLRQSVISPSVFQMPCEGVRYLCRKTKKPAQSS